MHTWDRFIKDQYLIMPSRFYVYKLCMERLSAGYSHTQYNIIMYMSYVSTL